MVERYQTRVGRSISACFVIDILDTRQDILHTQRTVSRLLLDYFTKSLGLGQFVKNTLAPKSAQARDDLFSLRHIRNGFCASISLMLNLAGDMTTHLGLPGF